MLNESVHRFVLLGRSVLFVADWAPLRWHSLCLTLDYQNRRLSIATAGATVRIKEDFSLAARQSDQLEVELLGQLDGRLADLHIWDRAINSKDHKLII